MTSLHRKLTVRVLISTLKKITSASSNSALGGRGTATKCKLTSSNLSQEKGQKLPKNRNSNFPPSLTYLSKQPSLFYCRPIYRINNTNNVSMTRQQSSSSSSSSSIHRLFAVALLSLLRGKKRLENDWQPPLCPPLPRAVGGDGGWIFWRLLLVPGQTNQEEEKRLVGRLIAVPHTKSKKKSSLVHSTLSCGKRHFLYVLHPTKSLH